MMIMTATLDDVLTAINSLKAQQALQAQARSLKFNTELSGCQTIKYANSAIVSSAGSSAGVNFNPKYFYNVVVRLNPNGVTTDVNVFVQVTTGNLQTPSKYLLNTAASTKLRLQDMQITNITSDSSLSTATLYVYYSATDAPDRVELDVN